MRCHIEIGVLIPPPSCFIVSNPGYCAGEAAGLGGVFYALCQVFARAAPNGAACVHAELSLGRLRPPAGACHELHAMEAQTWVARTRQRFRRHQKKSQKSTRSRATPSPVSRRVSAAMASPLRPLMSTAASRGSPPTAPTRPLPLPKMAPSSAACQKHRKNRPVCIRYIRWTGCRPLRRPGRKTATKDGYSSAACRRYRYSFKCC